MTSALGKAVLVAAGLALLLPAAPARPQTKTFCSEPVTPFCASRTAVFDDDSARDRCGDEVAKYVEGMQEFVTCLGQQQEEARARAEEIEERFACMARGDSDCP